MESREVNLDVIRTTADDENYVLTDENNSLGSLQNKQSSHHWKRENRFFFEFLHLIVFLCQL